MGRKAAIAHRIARRFRAQLTLRGVVIFVVGTAVGLFLAILLAKALGESLPWWLIVVAVAGATFMRFGHWLDPKRYNADEESEA